MKKQVAIYQSVKHDWMQHVADVESFETSKEHFRISEIETIEFKMLPGSVDAEIHKRAVDQAMKAVEEAKAKLEELKNG